MKDWHEDRNKIIGLGEHSLRKNYYAELQNKIDELEVSRSNLDSILSSMYDAVIIHDFSGNIFYCNKRALELFNIDEHEITNYSIADISSKSMNIENLPTIWKEVEMHKAQTIDWTALQIGTNKEFPVQVSINRINWEGTSSLVAVVRDITERKLAEEALFEGQQVFRTLVENSPDIIARYDRNCKRTYINPVYLKVANISPQELLSTSPVQRSPLPSDSALILQDLLRKVLDNGVAEAIDVIWRKTDNLDYWYNIYAFPEFDRDGKVMSVMTVSRDITERKRAEEEIRRFNHELEQRVAERTAQLEVTNKELEAFAYSVSHDLRAPLRHIDGFIELLKKGIATNLDEEGRHYMKAISDSAKRMGALIDDLLSFSRMGRNEMSKMQVDIEKLVQEVIREFNPEAEGRNINWQISALPTVTGDKAMLRIVFVNLISNALKFTRKRGPAEIEIGFTKDKETGTVIFVRDNGVGFDQNYASKLFGVFQRLHRADEFEGTGIGLANVRRIIARHGGRTWAEGEIEKGATFYFSI
jgi:PAS domain S-box-containing protein